MTADEDPLSLKQIISRYESAEEEFLRELESMQQCAANTDTSDEFQDDGPVLGTLCSLVNEINQLRKQNRKLRRRLVESSVPSTPISRPSSGVVKRLSTYLDAGRNSLLPKFMSSSSSSHSINVKKPPSSISEVRSGARERLSSPVPQKLKTNLAVSAYSTDLSSDGSLQRPPLVLPESDSSDADQVFQEVDLPDYDQIDDNCLSPCYPRRSLWRRSHRPPISDNTSPSSHSASSSIEPSDTMTSSRSSFLDMIGFKVRRRKPTEIPPTGKRKRRISEDGVGPSSAIVTKELSSTDPTQKHVSNSLKNVAATNNSGQPIECGLKLNGIDPRLPSPNKIRPKSIAAYLRPSDLSLNKSPRLKVKTKSWRSVTTSEDTNHSTYDVAALDEELQVAQDENIMLRNEIRVLKTRNTQLIEHLRSKSMQLSKIEHKIEAQAKEAKKSAKMQDALDRLFLCERINRCSESSLTAIENRLKEFETEIQATKNEALRNQQMVINSTFKEQSAYQTCLEQVERLQRENFCLLQSKASEFGINDKQIREKLELMPRYESLYSFAVRIVRKVGQLRSALNEKTNRLMRAEIELMNQQSALLIAHTQLERQKLKIEPRRGLKRPVSFHGDDLVAKMTKPHLNVFLPFKLHGSRIEQQRKSQNNLALNGTENLIEDDERIETEFLKFFDSQRCKNSTITPEREKLTQMAPRLENVIVYRNGRGTVSPMNSPLTERRRFISGKQSQSPLTARKERPIAVNNNEEEYAIRPNSWVDPNPPIAHHYQRQELSELRRLADDITNHRVNGADNYHLHDFSIQPSQIIRYSGRHNNGHERDGAMSSLQDISGQNLRSPSTTPILTRRVPILGFPERRLHKQQSFQISPNGSSYDNQPLYDSPPHVPESSDYGSIESRPANGLSRRPSSDRRPPGQKPFHIHHHHSRLPQLHSSNCAFNLSSNPPTGSTALKRSNAILRRNSPVLSAEQRPSILRQNALLAAQRTRQSASESPRMLARFQHQHATNHQQQSTITEEEEQLSNAADLPETRDFLQYPASRLPKPSDNLANVKKVGHWLNRFRLNSKRS